MTGAVLGLVASYVVLAVLLLSLNLKSAWRWTIKAAAIALPAGFFVVAFVAIEALLGWPTEARPPALFQLHAALVLEPNGRAGSAGAIYLWLSPQDAEGNSPGGRGRMPCPTRARCTSRRRAPGRACRMAAPSKVPWNPGRRSVSHPLRCGCTTRRARSCRRRPANDARLQEPALAPVPGPRHSSAASGRRPVA
jgi:hypothetical protein